MILTLLCHKASLLWITLYSWLNKPICTDYASKMSFHINFVQTLDLLEGYVFCDCAWVCYHFISSCGCVRVFFFVFIRSFTIWLNTVFFPPPSPSFFSLALSDRWQHWFANDSQSPHQGLGCGKSINEFMSTNCASGTCKFKSSKKIYTQNPTTTFTGFD